MISKEQINSLYATIANDLLLSPFDGEESLSFRCRAVYSAISKWVMALFSDRSYEDDETGLVSKAHVTRTAMEILDSFIKIDPALAPYFEDEKKLINSIQDSLVELGYINDGQYYFSYPVLKKKVAIANKTLVVNLDTGSRNIRGYGIWGKQTPEDIPIEGFLPINKKPIEVFKTILSSVSFGVFDSKHGTIEYYDVEKKRWEFYSEKSTSLYEYYVLKIDGGLEFKLLKNTQAGKVSATIPSIYSLPANESFFRWEIWRVIIGLCSYCGHNVTASVKQCYNGTAISIRLNGYVMPFMEHSLLGAMAWPVGNCNELWNFVTESGMKNAVVKLFDTLGIEVLEG